MLTMRPQPAVRIPGTAARETRKAVVRFVTVKAELLRRRVADSSGTARARDQST
jgi:hypothetical protein